MASAEMELRQRRENKEGMVKEGLRTRDAGPSGHSRRQEWVHASAALVVVAIITYLTSPKNLTAKEPTSLHVWYYGWLTALSTGLGALPLLMWSKPSDFWLGASNAIAAGMMLSASFSLVSEGIALDDDHAMILGNPVSHAMRVGAGMVAGMAFVVVTKSWVEGFEDLKLGDITGLDAGKILLILAVMTLHSFAEGLGIGVSFVGKGGSQLGAFISASLAVHNVPEGLAVALVLVPRGVSPLKTLAWAVCSSLPQPVVAVPVFMFVEHFEPWQSAGLGFAAGAMLWVACFELIADALKEMTLPAFSFSISFSFAGMMAISSMIDVATAHEV
jgi:ZIP family zinc transporter